MTHEQKPESAEFRTREEQTDALARAIGPEKIFSLLNQSYREEITARASSHILEAEARGAAEQRRKDEQSVEEAKDEGANYVLTSLALLFGRDGFEIRDGSETWEGDVNATLEGILKAGGLIDGEGDLLDLATLKDRLAEQRRKDAEGAEAAARFVGHSEDGAQIFQSFCADLPIGSVLYTRPANVAALEDRVKESEAHLGALQNGTVRQVIHSPLRHVKPEDRS